MCFFFKFVSDCFLQEGELELEVSRVKMSEAGRAAHSETLRDTAPVIEAIKVT